MQADTATKMSTNRGAHEESHADQDTTQPLHQDFSISAVLSYSVKTAEDARSSISSDKSDSKPPRSAMRRTSSIPKIPQSPRRVRFDFMGEEVLPTSSPQQSAFIAARISSPEPSDDDADCTSNLATEPGEEEEEDAPPRKVSSSDALRALSRAPLDEDGTVWTVVNSESDGSAEDVSQLAQTHQPENAVASSQPSFLHTPAVVEPELNTFTTQIHLQDAAFATTEHNLDHLDEDSTDEEDILSMAKRKAPPLLASKTPTLLSSFVSSEKAAESKLGSQNAGAAPPDVTKPPTAEPRNGSYLSAFSGEYEGEDDMFYFDGEGLDLPDRASKSRHESEKEHAEEEQSDDENEAAPAGPASLYATSPAVAIPRQMKREDEEPSTPSRPKFQAGTVGSYKGRPLTMPVLVNSDLLDKIHSSEPVNPVVGSIYDRSPADDLKPSIIEGSIDQRLAASAPRSFSERLKIEEMMEAAKAGSRSSGVQQL